LRRQGSETHEGKQLHIMQCSRMHPNRKIIITQVICIYKSITMFCTTSFLYAAELLHITNSTE
jgi:hypothetical protein